MRLCRGNDLQMNGRTGRSRIHRSNDEVVRDLRRCSDDYDLIFEDCAVSVIGVPKARQENLPEGERWISIIGTKTKKMITLIWWNIGGVSEFR